MNSSSIKFINETIGDNQQHMTVAELDLETMQDTFSNGRLLIICHANVFHLYKETAEISLKEERPRLASVLGTRESSYIGKSYVLLFLLIHKSKLKK